MSAPTPAMFIADATGLDFLNSIATPVNATVDWIDNGEGLLDWLEQAGLVPSDVLAAMRGGAMPGELDALAGQARDLREWFRGFVLANKGQALTAASLHQLDRLNALLARDEGFGRVVARESGVIGFERVRRWTSPESLLLPVGEAMAKLVSEEDFSYVKACEGPTCTLLFADHTRGHVRRWCSMSACGNRAKQLAHRQRARVT
ncbi:putative RNA-binding Zn ribbon-like protein [Luteibacter sp. OK325]|uniref:CGNR zinc finger domain-containing protein n=1 Tax=Luteibacter sp. OK325 TaxID=2135670 RepID=UPI000D351B17|nr:ABATE domain-containing protein [Luteibacter sp. OK325]PTR32518.1 putative RNA-binding Zn ribbon-like protein [Luteibacter sp. OK325]